MQHTCHTSPAVVAAATVAVGLSKRCGYGLVRILFTVCGQWAENLMYVSTVATEVPKFIIWGSLVKHLKECTCLPKREKPVTSCIRKPNRFNTKTYL
jgi:hypothetical protein